MFYYLVPTRVKIKLPSAYSGDPHALPFLSPLSNIWSPGALGPCRALQNKYPGPRAEQQVPHSSPASLQWRAVGNVSATHHQGNSIWALLPHEQVCRRVMWAHQAMIAIWVAKSLPLHAFSPASCLTPAQYQPWRSCPSSLPRDLGIAKWDKAYLLESQSSLTWEFKSWWSCSIAIYFSMGQARMCHMSLAPYIGSHLMQLLVGLSIPLCLLGFF